MSALASGPSFRPVKLAMIDVENCPEAIEGGARYGALWALVRENGRPRGMIRVPFAADTLDRCDLTGPIAALPGGGDAPTLHAQPGVALPPISVVIPSMMERLDGLRACLDSLARGGYPDYEVIVVDNRAAGSPPVSVEGARIICERRPGISAARNRGLDGARGEIVAFTDDDVQVDPNWLLAIALRFRDHPQEACVTGLALPSELETPAQVGLEEYYGGFGPRVYEPVSHRLSAAPRRGARGLSLRPATVEAIGNDGRTRRSFSLYAAGSFGAGANMAFRADVLRQAGGFDPALGAGTACRGGEDLVMFARLAWRGHRIGFEPAALVHHTHRRDEGALERQIEGYGLGYGALLMALVMEDPRHLGRMLGTARRVAQVMLANGRHGRAAEAVGGGFAEGMTPAAVEATAASPPDARTRRLERLERRAMLRGPLTYLRARGRRSW